MTKALAVTTIGGLRDAVVDFLKEEHVRIFLFGSRARGNSSASSDVDIGVLPHADEDRERLRGRLALLRAAIEEMNVPYKVELVDFSEVTERFRQEALKDTVTWKE